MKQDYTARTYTYKISGKDHRVSAQGALRFSLKNIPGLGTYLSGQICDQLGIPANFSVDQLTAKQKTQLLRMLTDHYTLGDQVRLQARESIERHMRMNSYRGSRLRDGLPVRGQRTHSNAYTAKKLKPYKPSRDSI